MTAVSGETERLVAEGGSLIDRLSLSPHPLSTATVMSTTVQTDRLIRSVDKRVDICGSTWTSASDQMIPPMGQAGRRSAFRVGANTTAAPDA
jgi:hypothetical protein